MPSPFPGMNPYLENPELWSDFHHRVITAIADLLAPQLEPKYIVAIERRISEVIGENLLLVGIPDVMVQRPLNATNSTTNVAILSPPAQPIIKPRRRDVAMQRLFHGCQKRVLKSDLGLPPELVA
jgi:hypothetical protein